MKASIPAAAPTRCCPSLRTLSAREWATLLLIADDFTHKQVADTLCITTKSAENYRNRIGRKLGYQGNGALARFARQHRDALHQVHEQLIPRK